MSELGEQEKVKIERITAGGKALFRGSKGVKFAPAGLFVPGDLVRVRYRPNLQRPNLQRGNLQRGSTVNASARQRIAKSTSGPQHGMEFELSSASPLRRNPPCQFAGDCGGCDLMAVSEPTQLEIKVGILEESLRRIGKLDPADLVSIDAWQGSATAYRNRVQFQVRSGKLGFLARESSRFVPVDSCPVCNADLNSLFSDARVSSLPDGQYQALSNGQGRVALVKLESNVPGRRDLLRLADFPAELAMTLPPANGIIASGQGRCESELPVAASDFFQSNLEGLAELRRRIHMLSSEYADSVSSDKTLRALEFYAGRGVLGAALSPRVSWILGTEIDAGRPGDQSAYGQRGQLVACDYASKLSQELEAQFAGRWDIALADPPRSGLDKQVLNLIGKYRPRLLLLVFCDPVSAARDCAKLVDNLYTLKQLQLLDFYPGTSHFETLAVLELKNEPL